jgi:uncharacterized damage-inducible protein DinB
MNLTLGELLDYSEEERIRWRRWFGEHGGAPLAIALPGDRITSVAGLIQHMFGAQLWYAEMLAGSPVTDWWTAPLPTTAEPLFRLGEEATRKMREYIAAAPPEDWSRIIELTADARFHITRRKAVANIVMHTIRHWGQVALVVRLNGMAPPGEHDLVFSRALD